MRGLVYESSAVRWMLCRAAGLFTPRAYYGPMSMLALRDLPMPELPGPQWVRLRTRLGGICGTDLALIAQRNHPATILQRFASFPAVLGHENVAAIEAVGGGARGWAVGQRVCVEPSIGCAGRGVEPLCTQCAAGRCSMCEHGGDAELPPRALVGLNRLTGGSWSEFFVAHVSQLHAVSDSLPDEQAVLIDPLASAAHAVLRRPPREGERVLVNGAGIIALGVIAAIRALGLQNEVVVTSRHAFQSNLARSVGATDAVEVPRGMGQAERYEAIARRVGGRRVEGRFGNQGLLGGFDLTYDCTGNGAGMTDAMKWTRARGCVVMLGTSGITLLDTTPLWFDELEIIGANGRQIEDAGAGKAHTYELLMNWVSAGRLRLDAFPVRTYRLEKYRTALGDLLSHGRKGVLKAAFDFRAVGG
ncbi:L-threonine 3-dehydrogenase [Phycisphaerae bacterium RAS2]|nr:L-threonine 3-dehydrogenase [Phycisphaerae bacterium RAS2]